MAQYNNVDSSIIHNNPKVGTTQISASGCMKKQSVV